MYLRQAKEAVRCFIKLRVRNCENVGKRMRCHECGVKMQPPIASAADGIVWLTHNQRLGEMETVVEKCRYCVRKMQY